VAQKEMDKEIEHSNSLWNVNWHEIKGLWLIVYEDDSSRFIVCYGVYLTLKPKYSVDLLKKTIEKPEEILSDH